MADSERIAADLKALDELHTVLRKLYGGVRCMPLDPPPPPDPSIADAHRRIDQLCHRIAELELKVDHLESARLSCSTEPSSCSGHGAQGDPATPNSSGDETARRDTLYIGSKVEVDTEHGIRLGDLVGFLENGKLAIKMYGQHYAIEASRVRRHGDG